MEELKKQQTRKQRFFPVITQDGEALLCPDFYSDEDAWLLFQKMQKLVWSEEWISCFNRQVKVPRLVAWYGNANANYTYSGVKHEPLAWTGDLLKIKILLERVLLDRLETEVNFNSVLANFYRHGKDSMGWHSDDEKELGNEPIIASLTFGARRSFQFRHRQTQEKLNLELPHGSLLLMKGKLQKFWQHQLPKRKKVQQPRINLTFREII